MPISPDIDEQFDSMKKRKLENLRAIAHEM